jgi:RNA polymerase sigma-70 factor (ECF subfamily)
VLWLERHGDALFRYAVQRTRSRDVAEDLVQETLLAALEARGSFRGHSAERTWLTAILRHNIVDHLRRALPAQLAEAPDDPPPPDPFRRRGNWKVRPAEWTGDPHALLERDEFRQVLSACLSKLPPRTASVFLLREAEEIGSEKICQELGISATNLWAMLHRARSRLRQCLTLNWFADRSTRREGRG